MPEPRLFRSCHNQIHPAGTEDAGVLHWSEHQGLGSTPGVPDIIGIGSRQNVGYEVKTARGKLSVPSSSIHRL
jgi:hypothetical protein